MGGARHNANGCVEVGAYNINVNVVCPGIVKTPRMDKLCAEKARVRGWTVEQVYQEYVNEMALKRVTEPKDVARAVYSQARIVRTLPGRS